MEIQAQGEHGSHFLNLRLCLTLELMGEMETDNLLRLVVVSHAAPPDRHESSFSPKHKTRRQHPAHAICEKSR